MVSGDFRYFRVIEIPGNIRSRNVRKILKDKPLTISNKTIMI